MTRLFMAGAEAGSVDVFNAGATCVVSTDQKRTGAYSFEFHLTYADHTLPASVSEIYMRMGLYPTQFGSAGTGTLLQVRDSAGDVQLYIYIDGTTGLMSVRRASVSGTLLATGAVVISLNQWVCLEFYIKIDNAPNGRFVSKVNGVTDIDFTGDTQQSALTNLRAIRLMYATGTQYTYGYLDDIAINDTAGAVNNSWIGRGGIYGIVPEGVGTYTDLHASAGNAWDCINEVPPDDADYVYDDTVDQKSTYALAALTPTTGTIDCINVIMRAKLDAAGTGNIARLIRSNGTDSQGADVGLDTSAKTIQEIIETDPSGGGAWTVARVNALEAGAVVR